MGLMDRARRLSTEQAGHSADESQRDHTESSTLAVVSPTLKRLRAVLEDLTGFVLKEGDERQRRMSKVLKIVIDEASDEMADMDENVLRVWMHNMACTIEWCATGDFSVLPPELLPFACRVEGIDIHDLFTVEPATDEVLPERAAIEG